MSGQLHYMTQDGQPYGSTRRCCEWCGAMIWPGMHGDKPAPDYTEDFEQWKVSEDRCDGG